ncbi:TlpA family protein disulfide reductase [Roseicitreum antarcticum]|uniref:Peroxiredoxin n=1 Tax=Roseicitreum antarcticum TaxID=564137 RepID=A0A1H3DDI1_9RHOB|nr:deiodinase-like protein [Roseicitreum antarcticum]SDX64446.1 Peroxiredoxin [Roseicitreum antarcticum]
MADYNYSEFSTTDYDFKNVHGPEIGDKAPDFALMTTEGDTKRLTDFTGDFLVLEMGSITCPLFQSRRGIMETLNRQSGVSTAVLYVREAHPGADVPGHKSFDDKKACATRLKAEDGETRTVFVDGLEGEAHSAYGSMPNAVFIINRNGCVVYRSEWNNPSATRKAVAALIAGRAVTAKDYFRPAVPVTVFRTLSKAGKGSAADFFKGLPFLIWTNIIKRNLRLFFGRTRTGSARTTC